MSISALAERKTAPHPITEATQKALRRAKPIGEGVVAQIDLAILQATVSQGRVFRGRHRRLESELKHFWNDAFAFPREEPALLWFLSDVYSRRLRTGTICGCPGKWNRSISE